MKRPLRTTFAYLLFTLLSLLFVFPVSTHAAQVTITFNAVKSGVTAPHSITVEKGSTYRKAFEDAFGGTPYLNDVGDEIMTLWTRTKNVPSSCIDPDASVNTNVTLYAYWVKQIKKIRVSAAIPMNGEILLPQLVFLECPNCHPTGARFLKPDMSDYFSPFVGGSTVILELTFEPDAGYGFRSEAGGTMTNVLVNARPCQTGLVSNAPAYAPEMAAYIDFTVTNPDGTLVLPSSLKAIGEEAFAFSKIQTVIVPNGTTSIGSKAFGGCLNLQRIILPESITYIAEDAFMGTHVSLMILSDNSYVRSYAANAGIIVYHEPAG